MGTILVTGAAGFAGGHLIEHLAAQGTGRIVGWVRSAPPAGITGAAAWERLDLLDRDAVRAAVRVLQPSQVYHCAGVTHVGQSFRDTATPLSGNVLATHHLLDALRRVGRPCRVLVPGSATVYAPSSEPIREDGAVHPNSPYGVSKLAQEMLGTRSVREDGLEVVLTRSFNHTGPRQTAAFAAASFARQVALIERGDREPVIRVGNLTAERDLTDVRDVVRAYTLLMARGTSGVVYNVASGRAITMQAVLDALVARARVDVRVEPDPALFRPNDTPILVGDISRLREATGWTPEIGLDQVLDDLLTYWRGAATA